MFKNLINRSSMNFRDIPIEIFILTMIALQILSIYIP